MGKKYQSSYRKNLTFMDLLLMSIVIFSPFFRGLYFEAEFLFFHLLTAATFVWFAKQAVDRKAFTFFRAAPDFFSAGLLLAYFISFLFAVNHRLAVMESMKMLTYFLVYWVAAYGINDGIKVNKYLQAIFCSGTIVSLLGLGAAFGTFNLTAAVIDGIITSTLQYKNSFGIFLVVINLIGLYFLIREESMLKRYLYGSANLLVFLALLGSQSRGAWLIYPLVLLLAFAGIAGEHRRVFVQSAFIQFIAAFAVAAPTFRAISSSAAAGWLWVLAGIVLVIGLEFAAAKLFAGRMLTVPRTAVVICSVAVLIVVFFFMARPEVITVTAQKVLPKQLAQRVQTINLNVHQVQERFAFYKDALKIVKEHPIIGIGGRGWRTAYQAYQSYYYVSKEIHSYYFKVLVETGFVGLTMLLGWLFSVIIIGFKNTFKTKGDERSLNAILTIAIITIAAHSIIDFNLSLGAISILLWFLAGLSTRYNRLKPSKPSNEKVKVPEVVQWSVIGLLAALLILIPGSLAVGRHYAGEAVSAMSKGNIQAAERLFEKAAAFDPLTASYKGDLAQLAYQQGRLVVRSDRKKAEEYFQSALKLVNSAVKLDPYNRDILYVKAEILSPTGQVDEAIAEVKKGISLGPYVTDSYTKLARTYFIVARYSMERDQYPKALEYAKQLVGVETLLRDTMNQVEDKYLKLWVTQPQLKVTPELALYLGQAYAFLGNYQRAAENFEIAAAEKSLKNEALLWWGVALEQEGKKEAASVKLRQVFKLNPDLKVQLGVIQNMLREFEEVR
ncbi:O-antigen ligase family protein [Metallumcola ferriviriculae]|uniref:O-antigen ligase family protein n=1 Tax=Metallumcola ferriviriculae TaxID=3039180 RepID=A0AAU0UNW9_9FIRM|nr:O-antigen ligase family protein [Desulfitibacteraceae bacterium MK1]